MLAADSDVKQIGNRIVQDLNQFVLGTEQADDMCLVVIGRV
jgi:serine phosphatase RsbU (regulator of sigma subunit)